MMIYLRFPCFTTNSLFIDGKKLQQKSMTIKMNKVSYNVFSNHEDFTPDARFISLGKYPNHAVEGLEKENKPYYLLIDRNEVDKYLREITISIELETYYLHRRDTYSPDRHEENVQSYPYTTIQQTFQNDINSSPEYDGYDVDIQLQKNKTISFTVKPMMLSPLEKKYFEIEKVISGIVHQETQRLPLESNLQNQIERGKNSLQSIANDKGLENELSYMEALFETKLMNHRLHSSETSQKLYNLENIDFAKQKIVNLLGGAIRNVAENSEQQMQIESHKLEKWTLKALGLKKSTLYFFQKNLPERLKYLETHCKATVEQKNDEYLVTYPKAYLKLADKVCHDWNTLQENAEKEECNNRASM